MREKLEVYQLTSVGDREVNQDSMGYVVSEDYALFVVADGLGGHHAGEKASQFFCQGLFAQIVNYQKLLQHSKQHRKEILEAWVSAAVDHMTESFKGDPNAANAHTTCVVLYLDDEFSATAHCGDSRVYRLNQNQLLWRTKDHSLIQQQLNEGKLTEKEMGVHPEQNQLIRSINIQKTHKPEAHIYPAIQKGETFLLCTDGFWEFMKEKDLLQLGTTRNGRADLKKMAKMMHLRAQGKGDNLSVQWIRCVM